MELCGMSNEISFLFNGAEAMTVPQAALESLKIDFERD
jgi:hypothetical protein